MTHDRRGSDCDRHRPWLVAFAAAGGVDASTPSHGSDEIAAGRHLEGCDACRREVEELALLAYAVRRAWRPTQDIEPPADAWPRLRERVSRQPVRPSRAASSVAGLALGTALTIGLLAPLGLGGGAQFGADPQGLLSETGSAPTSTALLRTPEERDERQWMLRQVRERLLVLDEVEAPVAGQVQEVRRPLLPRREQMRYAEDEPQNAAAPPAVPKMTVL